MNKQEYDGQPLDDLTGTYVFDGYVHRQYNEEIDGWRRTIPTRADYPVVDLAKQVLEMFSDLQDAHRRIWELEQRNKMLEPLLDHAAKGPRMPTFVGNYVIL